MFGGNNNKTNDQACPVIIQENQFQHGSNASELQLFGTFQPQINGIPVNYAINEQISPLNYPTKRNRNTDEISKNQMLQISLNTITLDEMNRHVRIPDSNTVSTGLRLFYDDEERNSSVTSACANIHALPTMMSLDDKSKAQISCQMDELNCHLKLQTTQLAKSLKEMNRRHTASFLSSIEKDACKILKERDLEIEEMHKRNRILTEKIRQLAYEAQSWQHAACYNEKQVNKLRNKLSKVTAEATDQGSESCGENIIDDAIFPCSTNLNFGCIPQKKNKVLNEQMICKVCRTREACMMIWNCRHLCLCEDCERFIDICPTCRTNKSSVIQVYMS